MSLSATGNWRHTATTPCGVTVSAIASSTCSVTKCGSSSASAAALRELGVPLERRRGHEQLDDELRPEGERLGHGLRTLEQEEPGLGAGILLGELRHRAHARRARVVDHRTSLGAADEREVKPRATTKGAARTRRPSRWCLVLLAYATFALTSAGSAALAVATIAANVAGSVTARSARMRRSTSMPARFRPWMKRL